MPIEIRCESCGKRYRVEERFAGKRVKCRNCESIISVPAIGEEDPDDLSALSAAAMSNESMGESVSSVAGAKVSTDESARNQDADAPPPSLPIGFGAALRAARSRIGTRQFRVGAYPGAQAIDTIVPWAVGAACLIPTVWHGFQAATANNPQWIGLTQYGLIFVCFLLLVIPVTVRGLRMSSEMLHFELPDSAGWRTLGLFSLPFALGAIFYWQLGELSGLVFGLALGLLLVGPLLLVVMQLHWVEAVVSWMMSVLFFGASAAVTAGIAFIVGLIIVASTAVPPPPAKVVVKTPSKPPAVVVATQPAPAPTDNPPPTTQELFTPVAPTPVPAVAASQPAVPDDTIAFVPLNPTPKPPVAPGSDANKPPAPKPDAAKIDPSPLVAAAKDMDWLGDFDDALSTDAAAAPLAVLKRSADMERIQIILAPYDKPTGEVSFKRDPAASDHYLVTPTGDGVLRIVTWPKLTVQVLPTVPGKTWPTIDLDQSFTNATLLGIANDQLFVKGDNNGQFGLFSWNLKTGLRGRPVVAPGAFIENGVAASPDGKSVAVATKIDEVSQIQLFNGAGGMRRLIIKSLDAKWPLEPVGLTFSPDSSRLAICFEHDGGVLIDGWNLATGKQLYEHVFLPGMIPTPPREQFKGRALDWVGDNNTWLLYGQTLIDANSGQALGTLGVSNVIGQRVTDAKSVDLVVKIGMAGKRIVHLDLNADAIAKARIATSQPAK